MNKYEFLKAIGDIDSELIEQAGRAHSKRIYILAAAACICAVVSITLLTAYNSDDIAIDEPPAVSSEAMDTYISDTAPSGISASDIEISYISGDKFVFRYRETYVEPKYLGHAQHRFFNGIMGKSGILVTTSTEEGGKGYFCDMYYAAEADKLMLIAENYGYRTDEITAVQKDLDGDGIKEFITNNTSLTNGGHNKMIVYSINDNIPYAGYLTSVSFESDTSYETDTGMVSYSYKSDFAFDNRYVPGTGEMTRKPLAYDMLTFEPFISSTANKSTDPFILCRYGDFTVEYASFENGTPACVLKYKDDSMSLPNYPYYDIMPFSGILDYTGVSVTAYAVKDMSEGQYHTLFFGTDKNDRLKCIGENCGICSKDRNIYENVTTKDIDGDGIFELISDNTSEDNGVEWVKIFTRKDDTVFAADILPTEKNIRYGEHSEHYNSDTGNIEYRWSDDEGEHYIEMRLEDAYINNSIIADSNNSELIPDDDTTDDWYGQNDLSERKIILHCGSLKREIDLTDEMAERIFGEYSWNGADLRTFNDIMGTDGVILSFTRSINVRDEWYSDYYFTVYDEKIVCIAHNFGERSSDEIGMFSNVICYDIDDDGREELIAIDSIIGEKRYDVKVYRFNDGICYAGKPTLPNDATIDDVRFEKGENNLKGYFYFSDGTSEVIPIDEEHIIFNPADFPI